MALAEPLVASPEPGPEPDEDDVAVLDPADQETIPLRKADGAPEPSGDERRRHRHAQAPPRRRLAATEGVDPGPELAIRRQGEVEALADTVRVEAEELPVRVEEGAA
jgi:hypothetical protein